MEVVFLLDEMMGVMLGWKLVVVSVVQSVE